MRTLSIIAIFFVLLVSCKNDKKPIESDLNNESVVDTTFTQVDSNIKLNDSIKIEQFAYKKIENDSTRNIEVKLTFTKESLPLMKTYKELYLYIHLYPSDSLQIKELPEAQQKVGFDNWSAYGLHTQNDFKDNVYTYSVKTKIYN